MCWYSNHVLYEAKVLPHVDFSLAHPLLRSLIWGTGYLQMPRSSFPQSSQVRQTKSFLINPFMQIFPCQAPGLQSQTYLMWSGHSQFIRYHIEFINCADSFSNCSVHCLSDDQINWSWVIVDVILNVIWWLR